MDEADMAQERMEREAALIQRLPYELPQGIAGECDGCGRELPRLINGYCGGCRDRGMR